MTKVAIVGGGPAGAYTAFCALRKHKKMLENNPPISDDGTRTYTNDLEVTIYDARDPIGLPVNCAGGTVRYWLDRLGIRLPEHVIRQRIRGIRIVGPNGDEWTHHQDNIGEEEVIGYVMDRQAFDQWNLDKAEKEGAEIRLGENPALWDTPYDFGDVDYIIGADGWKSSLGTHFGFDTQVANHDMHIGYEHRVRAPDYDQDYITFYLSDDWSPEGYCVTPSTPIITKRGPVAIKDVRESELVLTNDGWAKVRGKSVRAYNGQIVTITPKFLHTPVELTPEHQVLTYSYSTGQFRWKEAGEIVRGGRGMSKNSGTRGAKRGDFLVFPLPPTKKKTTINVRKHITTSGRIEQDEQIFVTIPSNRFVGSNSGGAMVELQEQTIHPKKTALPTTITLNEAWMELFGWYISEGWAGKLVKIPNTDEEHIERICNAVDRVGLNYVVDKQTRSDHKDIQCVNIQNSLLAEMLTNLFGKGSHNKRIPPDFIGCTKKLKAAFLRGMYLGDGSREYYGGRKTMTYTTISPRLATDLWMLLASMGIVSHISRTGVGGKAYRIRYNYGKRWDDPKSRADIIDNKVIIPIKNISQREYVGEVYDLQTNGSFTTSFCIHNCWIFPEGGDVVKVGLGIPKTYDKGVRHYLGNFLRDNPEFDGERLEKTASGSGMIPTCRAIREMTKEVDGRWIGLVGDAARMVDPLHGGGIATGMLGARILGATIGTGSSLAKFQRVWDHRERPELDRRYALKAALVKFRNPELTRVVSALHDFQFDTSQAPAEAARMFLHVMRKHPAMFGRAALHTLKAYASVKY